MVKDEFHSLLRQYVHRQTSLPIAVEMIDGRRIMIKQPPVVFSDGTASTIGPQDGALVDFTCEEVKTMGLLTHRTIQSDPRLLQTCPRGV